MPSNVCIDLWKPTSSLSCPSTRVLPISSVTALPDGDRGCYDGKLYGLDEVLLLYLPRLDTQRSLFRLHFQPPTSQLAFSSVGRYHDDLGVLQLARAFRTIDQNRRSATTSRGKKPGVGCK